MSEIEKFKQGAEILQQVDVTDIISSLAVGIADAQEQLDNNSIKQALALADPNNGIGGKSLLKMGFLPAFYHFQYADVSAEIALKMRLETEFEIDASLDFNYTKQGGYSADKLDYLREDSNHKSVKEFKSKRSVSTHANNYEELTIEKEKVKMSDTHGCVRRVEDFADQIRRTQKIDRVIVDVNEEKYVAEQMSSDNQYVMINSAGGYIIVTTDLPSVHEGVLKVTDYTLQDSTNIEFNGVSGDEFLIGQENATDMDTFEKVFQESTGDIGAGEVVGFKASTHQFFDQNNTGEAIEVYFDYDKSDARLALQTDLSDSNISTENNTKMLPVLQKLAKALRSDPTGEIRITGHTDGSGGSGYNERLSKKRSKSLHDWFVDHGVKSSQIKHTGTGETIAGSDQNPNLTFRKAVIEFISSADYFYYKGGNFDGGEASPSPADQDVNKFIYTYDFGAPGTLANFGIGFEINNTTILDASSDKFNTLAEIQAHTSIRDSFTSEIIGNSLYLLHNERQIKYSTFSKESETQNIAIGSREEEDFSDTNSRYMVEEISNTKTRIKKDQETRKNPSTIAVGASVDVRVARQFEMNVSGNAKVSARLVSLPAPPEFLDEVKSYYNQ